MGRRIDLDIDGLEGAWLEVKPAILCPTKVVLDMRQALADTMKGVATEGGDLSDFVRTQQADTAVALVYGKWAVEKWSVPGLDEDTTLEDLPWVVFDALEEDVTKVMTPTRRVARVLEEAGEDQASQQESSSPESLPLDTP